ncbi:MAG: YXWGXW repeat-containing protein [Rhodopirellula sp.]|nr:YXWGXW repeat-containing protein [Rhodopirellula sp.]
MDIRIRSLALVGALMATPLIAAPPPPPPPAPSSNGASASGEASAKTEIQPRGQQPQDQNAAATASVEDNVALRGPLHEAFARPISHDPLHRQAIKKQPPEAIDEFPPEYRPDGDNVIWIPGYWSYEDSEDEFLWISGLWRDVPPGRRWMPGYWSPIDGGHLWTPGEWVGASQKSISYLPEPPRSQERGPSSDAPDNDHFWVPGCWEHRDNDYGWRPGYWSPYQENWVWVPAHYDWTPNGYVYCSGYWDYDIDRRGIVYAPHRFNGHPVGRYTPHTVLNIPHLMLHLFVNGQSGGYHFGDYYGRDNYQPWYSHHSSRRGYDPIYTYNSWRNGDGYQTRLTGWNTYFTSHQDFRPRRTLSAQQQFLSSNTNREVAAQVNIAQAVTNTVGSELFGQRIIQVSGSERDSFVRSAGALQVLAGQRLDVESRGRGRGSAAVKGQGKAQTESLTLPELTGAAIRGSESRGPKATRTPALPGVKIGEAGKQGKGRSNDAPGKGSVKEAVGGAVKGTPLGKGKNAPKSKGGVLKGVNSAVPGTNVGKKPKAAGKTQPTAEPKPKAKPLPTIDPKPQPKADPKPQPTVDPAPKPAIPNVKKPKKDNGGKSGGGKPKGKSGGLVPSVPGL